MAATICFSNAYILSHYFAYFHITLYYVIIGGRYNRGSENSLILWDFVYCISRWRRRLPIDEQIFIILVPRHYTGLWPAITLIITTAKLPLPTSRHASLTLVTSAVSVSPKLFTSKATLTLYIRRYFDGLDLYGVLFREMRVAQSARWRQSFPFIYGKSHL